MKTLLQTAAALILILTATLTAAIFYGTLRPAPILLLTRSHIYDYPARLTSRLHWIEDINPNTLLQLAPDGSSIAISSIHTGETLEFRSLTGKLIAQHPLEPDQVVSNIKWINREQVTLNYFTMNSNDDFFTQYGGIAMFDMRGTYQPIMDYRNNRRNTRVLVRGFDWAENNQRVAVARGQSIQFYDTCCDTALVNSIEFGQDIHDLVRSPDGTRIAFVTQNPNPQNTSEQRDCLYVLDVATMQHEEIHCKDYEERSLANRFNSFDMLWSPDSENLLFKTRMASDAPEKLYVLNAIDGTLQMLQTAPDLQTQYIPAHWVNDHSVLYRYHNGMTVFKDALYVLNVRTGNSTHILDLGQFEIITH